MEQVPYEYDFQGSSPRSNKLISETRGCRFVDIENDKLAIYLHRDEPGLGGTY